MTALDLTPYLKKDGSITMSGALNMGSNAIQGLNTGALTTSSVNRGYVDGADTVLQGQIDNLTSAVYTKA